MPSVPLGVWYDMHWPSGGGVEQKKAAISSDHWPGVGDPTRACILYTGPLVKNIKILNVCT